MDWITLIIYTIFIIALGIAIIYLILKIQDKKLKATIPKEIVADFEEAERRYKNDRSKDPHTILWELNRRAAKVSNNETSGVRDKGVPTESGKQSDIQISSDSTIGEDKSEPSGDVIADARPKFNWFRKRNKD